MSAARPLSVCLSRESYWSACLPVVCLKSLLTTTDYIPPTDVERQASCSRRRAWARILGLNFREVTNRRVRTHQSRYRPPIPGVRHSRGRALGLGLGLGLGGPREWRTGIPVPVVNARYTAAGRQMELVSVHTRVCVTATWRGLHIQS